MDQKIVRNFQNLAATDLRLDAVSLVEAGYAAINTESALEHYLHLDGDTLQVGETVHELGGRRVFFVGVGKCAISGAHAIEKILGDTLTAGIALDVAAADGPLAKIETYIGTHPLPSETNVHATEKIVELLTSCTKDDLVLMLISGGGSTLLCLPTGPMTPADESELFTKLTCEGASIQEVNTVRKHTSLARGGGLAKSAYPAEVISLIISDVPGNDTSFIASGPTVPDHSTIADARAVLSKYGISEKDTYIFTETPKEETYFERVTNLLFLTNRTALLAMQSEATKRGYAATIMQDQITGEARDIGHAILETLHALPSKTVLLYAGETTVTFGKLHRGAGGRNQEMALAALAFVHPDELLLPFSSDGRDNSDHAGAIADAVTLEHATAQQMSPAEYLADHRSYDFFKTTDDALLVGYTESNVSDLIIAIKK
ncbi:MAG: glycerate kinase [Candidatus Paceibacteria bacterium]